MTSLQATGRVLSFSVLELIAGQDNGARDARDARDAEKSDDDGIPKLSNPDRVAANEPTRVLKFEWKYRSHAAFLLPGASKTCFTLGLECLWYTRSQ